MCLKDPFDCEMSCGAVVWLFNKRYLLMAPVKTQSSTSIYGLGAGVTQDDLHLPTNRLPTTRMVLRALKFLNTEESFNRLYYEWRKNLKIGAFVGNIDEITAKLVYLSARLSWPMIFHPLLSTVCITHNDHLYFNFNDNIFFIKLNLISSNIHQFDSSYEKLVYFELFH